MSKEALLSLTTMRETQQSRVESDLGRYYNSIDLNRFGGSTVVNYFKEEQLVPMSITLSSRFLCILFEPLNGRQTLHILQRYSNQKLIQKFYPFVIKTFQLYDPLDCGVDNVADGCAHLIMTLNRTSELDPSKFIILKINKNNSISEHSLDVTKNSKEYFQFSSVSIDFNYFALSMRRDGNTTTYGTNTHHYFQFAKKIDGKLQFLKPTKGFDVYDPSLEIFSKATFIGTTGKAICGIIKTALLLVDVETSEILSRINIDTYRGLELGYYLDSKQYFYMDRDKAQEYQITFERDNIDLVPVKPVMDYQPEAQPQFSYGAVPYQYTLSQITSVYDKSNNSSFCVQQETFELTMDDIKYSRSIVLPRLKAIYAIRKVAPYDVIILDLTNLDIKFITTVSVPKLMFGIDTFTDSSQLVLQNWCHYNSDVSSNNSVVKKFSQFIRERLPNVGLKSMQNVEDFDITKNFVSIKDEEYNKFYVYDLRTQQKVSEPMALNLTFSQDGLAFIANISGYNYTYFVWNEQFQYFKQKVPLIKNAALRIEFMPESNSKLVIFDEFYNSLIIRDFATDEVTTIFHNCTFDSTEYIVINQDLIAYQEFRNIDGKKVKVFIIYNIKTQVVEHTIIQEDKINDIKLSIDKNFLYIASEKGIKVLSAADFSQKIGYYSIPNVQKIIEKEDRTYFICKHDDKTYQILGVNSINPIRKTDQMTSGNFIMKFIMKGLQSDLQIEKEQAIKAYMLFYKIGMVDSHLGTKGETLLHYIIECHRSSLLNTYFQTQEENPLYQMTFQNLSPVKLAFEKRKTEHLNIMLEYFLRCPEKFIANGEDLIVLMQAPLQSAKLMVAQLFSHPTFHQCQLPYTITSNKDILLMQIGSHQIGPQQCDDIIAKYKDEGGDEKVVLTTATKFDYNFDQGTESSLQFLKLYANSDSEEIVRSNLRLIVQHKYLECLPFLKIQCSLFFLLLLILFIKMIYFPSSIIVSLLLFAMNTLFMAYEINQIKTSGIQEYFFSIWNYSDITGFVLLYIVNISYLFPSWFQNDITRGLFTFIAVITVFCLTLRGMSHLRIFNNLRYLINMVVEIIKDMSSFTILLMYWILGFNLMFYLFAMSDFGYDEDTIESNGSSFFSELTNTYKLSFGDFQTDNFTVVQWGLFMISSFFIPLVLFNLIIAIMGDTYDRVQTSARMVDLQEQANLVIEFEGLMNWKRQNIDEEELKKNKQKLLICYNQEQSEELGENFAWEGKIKGLQKSMQNQIMEMKMEIIQAVSQEIKDQFTQLRKQQNY